MKRKYLATTAVLAIVATAAMAVPASAHGWYGGWYGYAPAVTYPVPYPVPVPAPTYYVPPPAPVVVQPPPVVVTPPPPVVVRPPTVVAAPAVVTPRPVYASAVDPAPVIDARIAWAQQALNTIARNDLTVDGIVGPATANALTSFQAANGIPTTGVVDSTTIATLDRRIRTAHVALPPPPAA